MKIILEFSGATAVDALSKLRAFAEAWANVYANAALPDVAPGDLIQSVDLHELAKTNAFLDEVSALEQRDDLKPAEKPAPKSAKKPAPKPANPVRRKQVEAAFRAMVGKYGGGSDALEAGRAVLKQIGATSVPSIPEAKLAECLALLSISECYHTAGAFVERLQSHEAAA